jgi:hypothetical protein
VGGLFSFKSQCVGHRGNPFRDMEVVDDPNPLQPLPRHCSLSTLLRRALKDLYVRKNKSSRNYPRKKNPDPPAGPPEIVTATRAQIRHAKGIRAAA